MVKPQVEAHGIEGRVVHGLTVPNPYHHHHHHPFFTPSLPPYNNLTASHFHTIFISSSPFIHQNPHHPSYFSSRFI
ncbi:hypothetical protein L6452_07427 [Arctium lappa]|uniref:Uncharacterized protein n=1 Tax=Arctium lappa TaxID=4217 RepID=A0ACB9EL62_ARCLA|nr:hypothetical protein L6452_07427 [Arctium lappa]